MSHQSLFPPAPQSVLEGAWLLCGAADSAALYAEVQKICHLAPVRHMKTPRGFAMSAAMTSCGDVGWVSDRQGYRYSAVDPQTRRPWPDMPASFLQLAQWASRACGFNDFKPDACLINRYSTGAQMGAHQDADEQDFSAPIVSVSLGLPARFFFLGFERRGRSIAVELADGDVLVFGGPARKRYHGVRKLKPGTHPLTGGYRWNLTFRKAQ